MVTLDERLSAIETLAGRCGRLVDVGTNHGFLPVHMLQSGLCDRAVLADISADALSRAEKLLHKTQLQAQAELRVADGLEGMALRPDDVVTICGMGARTIMHILAQAPPCPVVTQANVEIALLRRHLEHIGMHLTREDIALHNGRFYVILRAEPGSAEPLDEYEAAIGPCLLRDKPARLREYLLWRRGVTQRALDGMNLGRDAQKREQARREAEFVRWALEETV